ncbi:MAG: SbcC/MukB-like Walker B domain-containing protein [Bacteroidota bacterium]
MTTNPQQAKIFNEILAPSGFRLHYLQIYNWGTFGENRIWTISPNDKTALLTGANGSGKTTLVDAILTLLVPTRSRFYNQSSGTETRRSRTEASYVRGAYGSRQLEGQLNPETLFDRDRNGTYSVLLACFHDPARKQFLSLGQVRWFMGESDKLNQEFFAASTKLDILCDQIRYDPVADRYWKDRLKKERKVQFFTSFSQYQNHYLRAFGMRSHKAVTLFNRTVGIKVLGNLDSFIREEMLDRGNWEGSFGKLRESFETVRSSYRAFEKARQQLEMLEPIHKAHERHQHHQQRVEALEMEKALLPAWFAREESRLLREKLDDETRFLENAQGDEKKVALQLTELRDQQASVKAALKANEIQQQIDLLEADQRRKEQDMGARRKEAERYAEFARALDLSPEPNAATFEKNRTKAKEMLQGMGREEVELKEKEFQARKEYERIKVRYTDLAEELDSLRKRRNKIPKQNLRIRQGILDAVGAQEQELPFVGELLQIRPEERAVWENAIERVMHNYALRLLVPEKYYHAVNRHVNDNDLRGRLIYLRVDAQPRPRILQEAHPDLLWQKLEIKPDSTFYEWLENKLPRRFDYLCTTDLNDFRNASKALTPQGLSKIAAQHEKDDRKDRFDRSRYVLGWDNQEKIRLIEEQLVRLNKEIRAAEKELERLRRREKILQERRSQLKALVFFDEHARIDWKSVGAELEKLARDLKRLRKSLNSKDIRELQRQLAALETAIDKLEAERSRLLKRAGQLENSLQSRKAQLAEAEKVLAAYDHLDLDAQFPQIAYRVEKFLPDLRLTNLQERRKEVEQAISPEYANARRQSQEWQQKLFRAMNTYRNPPAEVTEKFRNWTGATRELGSGIEFVHAYLEIYHRIRDEKLLEYQARFQKFLNEKMIQDMSNFTTELDLARERIDENIRSLNDSLQQITYKSSPQETYIQLESQATQREEIRDFRRRVRSSWKPDMGQYARSKDIAILERSFQQIRGIIDLLSEDENYRQRVLDVRNWYHFSAKEYYRNSGEVANAYTTTGHLSGGEKAQITYTILGAALAYQFGIKAQASARDRSFRFIVVDEAFSKLDPEKSRYLMDLCRQLKLQLLVVTPLDKIHVVEQYIDTCHYVENKDRRHSRVYNLSIERYQELKQQLRASGTVLPTHGEEE